MANLKKRLERLEEQLLIDVGEDGLTLEEWEGLSAPGGILFGLQHGEERDSAYNNYLATNHPDYWERAKERILRTQQQIKEVLSIFNDDDVTTGEYDE